MARDRAPVLTQPVHAFERGVERFFKTVALNSVVFVAATFFWGVPAVTIFRDLEWFDGSAIESVVGESFVIVLSGLLFYGVWALLPQLALYSLLLSLRPRRVWAIVFAPIAVGIFYAFAEGLGPTAFLAGLTLSFGLSAYAPGERAWWHGHPRRVVAAVAIFTVACLAAGLSQKLPGSDRTSLTVTVTQDGARKDFQLDCQYDQGGRVRGSEPQRSGIAPHPEGRRACGVLKSVEDAIDDHPSGVALNTCSPGTRAPLARLTGVYRNDRIGELTAWRADCPETYFVGEEPFILVPPVRSG